ncbi:hypothetical protein [Ramlibacter sp.]|uniref:hypothetical protein n=1 Tax=Ramlibacter sp. TaxID=1917967 RepID=UPI003D0B8BC1
MAMKKIAGLIAGVASVAVIGVAVAQGVPPNPYVTNHALGAGQQSTHMTSMGETGVPGFVDSTVTATVITEQPVAVAPAPVIVEERVAIAEPAPVVVEQQQMGASPAPAAEPAPMPAPRRDRG